MKDKNFKEIMESIDVDTDDMVDMEDIIDLDDDVEADIVYEQKDRRWLKLFFIIPIGVVVFAIFLFAIALTQVKIVPASVVGADYNIAGYSIVSNNYKTKSKDIVEGSTVIIADKSDAFIGPFMKKYKTSEIGKIKNQSVFIKQSGTKDMKQITIYDIMYVVESSAVAETDVSTD